MGNAGVNSYEDREAFNAPPDAVVDAVVAALEGMGASRIERSYRPPRVQARTRINWMHWRERIHARVARDGALVVSSRAFGGAAFGVAKHKQNVDSVLDHVRRALQTGAKQRPSAPPIELTKDVRSPLSPGGQVAAGVVCGAVGLVLLVAARMGVGFPAELTGAVGDKLGAVFLLAGAGGAGLVVGVLWDALTRAGLFAPDEPDDEGEG